MLRIALVSLLMTGFVVFAQMPAKQKTGPQRPNAPNKTLADQTVEMIRSKMPDEVILNLVRSGSPKFSAEDFRRFQSAGASPGLLIALSRNMTQPGDIQPQVDKPKGAETQLSTSRSSGQSSAPPYSMDLSLVRCETPATGRKRVLAVQEFDFGAARSQEQAVFNTEMAVGKGMSALAIKRIAETKHYRVVERAMLNTLLQEQDLADSGRVKAGTSPRKGGVVGVDAYVLGTIVIFGPDDKHTGIGGLFGKLPVIGGLKIGKTTNKWVVAVNYKLVDAETSEILGQDEARGEAERKGKSIDVGAILGSTVGGAGLDMSSSNFQDTIIGEATMKALDVLMAKLNQEESKIPLHFVTTQSRVADTDGPLVTISAGSTAGVLSCDRFVVSRIVKEIKDPVTGEVLDLQLRKLGEMVVTSVRDNIATGGFQGIEAPRIGDVVEKIKVGQSATQPAVQTTSASR